MENDNEKLTEDDIQAALDIIANTPKEEFQKVRFYESTPIKREHLYGMSLETKKLYPIINEIIEESMKFDKGSVSTSVCTIGETLYGDYKNKDIPSPSTTLIYKCKGHKIYVTIPDNVVYPYLKQKAIVEKVNVDFDLYEKYDDGMWKHHMKSLSTEEIRLMDEMGKKFKKVVNSFLKKNGTRARYLTTECEPYDFAYLPNETLGLEMILVSSIGEPAERYEIGETIIWIPTDLLKNKIDNYLTDGDKIKQKQSTNPIRLDYDEPMVSVRVTLGETKIPASRVYQTLLSGKPLELDRLISEPVEVEVGFSKIAKGEIINVKGRYAIKITDCKIPHR